jgi:arylsulfatase A-like enzyme/Flp pilus assembly protein TadD
MEGMSDGQQYNSFCIRLALYISTVFLLIFVLPFFILGNPSNRTNVLLITVDTLRADRVSSYDGSHLRTPHFDGLAEQGVVFTRAFANTSTTLPSHANILLGVSPLYHGVHENQHFVVRENFLTMAEHLKVAEYSTGAFVGAFPLDRRFGLDQGFDVYDDEFGNRSSARETDLERRAEDVTAKALPWVKSQNSPWFLWIHVYDPHDPYIPPAPYAEQYAQAPYDGEVAYVDKVLGMFLDELRAEQYLEDTLVIFTGDHGESLGQHSEKTHGFFAYNTAIWIPLMISGPGIKPGRVEHQVSHLDIFPTVCDVLDLKQPEFLQGRSLMPAMRGRQFPKRALYFESLSPYYSMGWAPLQGYIYGDFKFIESPIPELYDLEKDFSEQKNLASDKDLSSYRKGLREIIEMYTFDKTAEAKRSLDGKSLEKLRALGYTGGSVAVGTKKEYGPRDDVKILLPYFNRSEDALKLYQEGKVKPATDLLNQVITERNDLANAYVHLAAIHFNEKNQEEALDILKKGFSTNSQSYQIFSKYVNVLARSGRFEKVLELFQAHYFKEMDHDPKIWNLMAMAHLNSGDPDGAKKALEQAIPLDPRLPLTHYNYGKLYAWIAIENQERGAVAKSLDSFKKAIELDPNFADAYIDLGVAYLRSGEQEGGIYCLEKALEIKPNSPLAVYDLGLAYLNSGNKSEALKYFTRYKRDYAQNLSQRELERLKVLIQKCTSDS